VTIVCVRHGETEWSRTHRHTGHQDIPLNDTGREQARAAGERLAGRDFTLVLSSPLGRALDTARLAGFADPELLDDLREWDYGDAEGRTADEMGAGWDLWRDGVTNGEALAALSARADRVIDRIAGVEGDVLIFAHGHLLRVLAARWLGQPPEFAQQLLLGNATLSELEVRRDVRVIGRWNTA
jgi:broad specificity phosphatase PhoE